MFLTYNNSLQEQMHIPILAWTQYWYRYKIKIKEAICLPDIIESDVSIFQYRIKRYQN